MERFEKQIYIIRFREGNKINTLKVNDKDTVDYMINKLEEESINYLIVKEQYNCQKNIVNDLLDYRIEVI